MAKNSVVPDSVKMAYVRSKKKEYICFVKDMPELHITVEKRSKRILFFTFDWSIVTLEREMRVFKFWFKVKKYYVPFSYLTEYEEFLVCVVRLKRFYDSKCHL